MNTVLLSPGGTFVIGVTVCITINTNNGGKIFAVGTTYVAASSSTPSPSTLSVKHTFTVRSVGASAAALHGTSGRRSPSVPTKNFKSDAIASSTIPPSITTPDSITVTEAGPTTVRSSPTK